MAEPSIWTGLHNPSAAAQYVVPDHMWMGQWGLLHRQPTHFLGGRALRVLPGVSPPRDMQVPRQIQQQAYNPSIVRLSEAERARVGCTSCAFVATVRVDWMTQCMGFTKLLKNRQAHAAHTRFGMRKGTLVMLLNSTWQPTHWGWLRFAERGATELKQQGRRLEEPAMPAAAARLARRPAGVLPRNLSAPWLLHPRTLHSMAEIVDARLLVVSGQLHTLGSIPATAYRAQLAPLHLSLGRSSGLHSDAPAELFATSRRTEATFLRHGRCAGRSQSFFEWNDTNSARGRKTGPSVRLMFQAWLAPAVTCELSRAPRKSLRPASVAERPNSDQPVFVGTGLRNVARGSCLAQRRPTTLQRGRNGAATCKLSLNGVSVRLSDGRLLGIGHLHRGFRDTLDGSNLSRTLTYFAHHYTHFFYAQEAAPPFVISMLGSEFCIGSPRARMRTPVNTNSATGAAASDAGLDCEIVQYVTGMVLHGDTLTLSYGINDCSSKLVDLRLKAILDDLRPPSALTPRDPAVPQS